MNILSFGPQYFSQPLRHMGHNVVSVNFTEDSDLVLTHPTMWSRLDQSLREQGFSADAVIFLDGGNLPLLLDPFNISCPSIFYSIDTYCNPWHIPYAHNFDLAFVAQKDFVPLFLEDGQKTQWLPLFCHGETCNAPFAERKIPVSFVGTLGHGNNPDRKPFLEKFNAILPLDMRMGDYRPVFSTSRIVLNQTAFSEINFRCFEAMSLGAALLMERCENGMEDLFTPGENILPPYTRNNAVEAARIADLYLKRPLALAEIAENGRQLVISRHDNASRARTLLAAIDALRREENHLRRLADDNRGIYARTAFGMLASELDEGKFRAHRDFFLDLARR